MVNAQEWMNRNYSKSTKKKTRVLDIKEKGLTESLIILDWPQLEKIDCSINQLSSLTIEKCPQLRTILAWNNHLNSLKINYCPEISTLRVETNRFATLDFLNGLNAEKLTDLRITNNKSLTFHDLATLSKSINKFVNLERLGICNMLFSGSLEPLKSLKKLKWLDVRATNLTSGLEYLPDNLEEICCDNDSELARKMSGCFVVTGKCHCTGFYCYREWRRKSWETINKMKNIMTNWKENNYPFRDFNEEITELWRLNGFDKKTTREWLEVGLKPTDYDFAEWLVKKKRITPEDFLDNYDYDSTRDNWFESTFNETVSIDVATVENKEGKRLEFWDTSNLEKKFIFDRKKEMKRIELLKQLDKGKKIRTRIAEIDPIGWGPTIRFTIDKENRFRAWDGTEGCVSFLTNDISPYNTWEVGDLIEIDLERLNSEKYTFEPLKEKDGGIVKLVERRKKENQTENKKLNKQAKLRLKVREKEERIKQLEEELTKEKQSKKELAKEFKELEKKYSEYVEQNTIMLFK